MLYICNDHAGVRHTVVPPPGCDSGTTILTLESPPSSHPHLLNAYCSFQCLSGFPQPICIVTVIKYESNFRE